MYYDKRVRYIDYLENDEKRRNCGYVKAIVNNGSLLLQIQIKGLYETDDVTSEVTLEGDGVECHIGTVAIRQGGGSFCREFQDPVHEGEEMEIKEGLRYGHLRLISIQISPRRSLRCIWKENGDTGAAKLEGQIESQIQNRSETGFMMPQASAESKDQGRAATSEEQTQSRGKTDVMTSEEQVESGDRAGVVTSEERAESRSKNDAATLGERAERSTSADAMLAESGTGGEMEEIVPQAEKPAEIEPLEKAGEYPRQELHTAEACPGTVAMCEDKWQQLQMIYPHIYPFQDEREYLSLRPEDFVILSLDAYRLVRNSFLLHGYYNYKHLILTCVSQRGTGQYYIGVPGNFYEKEKQVAIMYGFSSFECKHEPAEEGDFGYYMIRVSI